MRPYVGTIVGESTSREFRLALAHEAVREQDIVAVDATIQDVDGPARQSVRVWAKVQRIERLNPLFPAESGHELAATKTDPFDTVLSLSREMVTAVCQVIGVEPLNGSDGKLSQLRYPAPPASSAYRPSAEDLDRIVMGALTADATLLDIANLANRPEVAVKVDGHPVVTRHLAILAMTGGGKSWAARRIVEEIARRKYPIVIFDPRGDYTGLEAVPFLASSVRRYFARFPILSEESDKAADIISALAYELTDTMRHRFGEVFEATKSILSPESSELQQRSQWLSQMLADAKPASHGMRPDLWAVATIAQAGEKSIREENQGAKQQLADWGWPALLQYTKTDCKTLEGIMKRARRAAGHLHKMERTNAKLAGTASELPTDRRELVKYGQVSVVSLAGYTGEFQATIFSLVASDLFNRRVAGDLLPVFLVLEEAHNFAPGKAESVAEKQSVFVTRQIAQEGRKFGLGLLLISQRPSRLDETTLSQCNSYVILRMVNPADQNFVRRVVETLSEDEARMLPNLDKGEAILSGQFVRFPLLVKMKPPISRGEREEENAFALLESERTAMQEPR